MSTRVKKNRRIAKRTLGYIWIDDTIEKSRPELGIYKTFQEGINAAEKQNTPFKTHEAAEQSLTDGGVIYFHPE